MGEEFLQCAFESNRLHDRPHLSVDAFNLPQSQRVNLIGGKISRRVIGQSLGIVFSSAREAPYAIVCRSVRLLAFHLGNHSAIGRRHVVNHRRSAGCYQPVLLGIGNLKRADLFLEVGENR